MENKEKDVNGPGNRYFNIFLRYKGRVEYYIKTVNLLERVKRATRISFLSLTVNINRNIEKHDTVTLSYPTEIKADVLENITNELIIT